MGYVVQFSSGSVYLFASRRAAEAREARVSGRIVAGAAVNAARYMTEAPPAKGERFTRADAAHSELLGAMWASSSLGEWSEEGVDLAALAGELLWS